MRIIGKIQWNLSMISQHFEIIITIKKMLVKRSVHDECLNNYTNYAQLR